MQAFGQSKKEAMKDGTAKDKIFSYNTYKTYWKHTKYFVSYMKENHPQVTTLSKSEKYVNEFLQSRVDQGLSAWTIQTEAKAIIICSCSPKSKTNTINVNNAVCGCPRQ